MASSEILDLSLTDLSWLIAGRKLSSAEVVAAALAQLERLEGKLNAFITVLGEQARADAKKADEEIARGEYRGALHGVPVTIKDMFDTAGVRTTGGSKILQDWIPQTDSALVERLRAAGAVIIGKTNLDEFGHGGTSTLSHFGPVHNPWNVERIAGGSSGGSAAAVASRIGPISYGTETGSSVRRPASYCGIVGFKPTFGIISRHGSFRGAWSQDHVGLFARTVKDITLALDPVTGYDARDPASVHQDIPAYAARLETNVKGIKVGVLKKFLDGVDPAVRAAFEAAIKILAGEGCEIVDLDVPEISFAAMTSMLTSSAESAGINRRWFREHYHDFVPQVARGLAVGMAITASEYLTAQRARQRIREAVRSGVRKSRHHRRADDGASGAAVVRRRKRQRRRRAPRELQSVQSAALPEHARPARLLAALWEQSRRPTDRHATDRPMVRRSDGVEYRCGLPEQDRLAHAPSGDRASIKLVLTTKDTKVFVGCASRTGQSRNISRKDAKAQR